MSLHLKTPWVMGKQIELEIVNLINDFKLICKADSPEKNV